MTDNLVLDMKNYLPLRIVVFRTLRNAILKGELKPGERLMEVHLANTLGVSRTPIREAIRLLEKEGLVVTSPRKGAEVASMTEKSLEDVLEVRNALDELAVTVACKNLKEDDIFILKEKIEDFKEAVSKKNVRDIVKKDEAFHDAIYKITKNDKLLEIISNLREQMYRYRYEYIKTNADYNVLVEEHNDIFMGLIKRDALYVQTAMHRHLENQIESLKKIIRNQQD